MNKTLRLLLGLALLGFACGSMAAAQTGPSENGELTLRENWAIQSSARVHATGEAISASGFNTEGWYPASVPTTVLNALIENKVYPDPYMGMNLRRIPGVQYPVGENFSNLPMPPDSPFRVPWWYRREFQLPSAADGKTLWLHFDGINFRANIWVNGHRIADASTLAGAFRVYEFDITGLAKPGAANAVAVEVFPPRPDDLGITWVDVNPGPPDKDMGIWQAVYITTCGPVALRFPQVVTRLNLPALDVAHLTVSSEVRNTTENTVKGVLQGQIASVDFRQEVELGPREKKRVTFTPERFPQLNISHPRLWWPWQMGSQDLYDLQIEFRREGDVSDSQELRFGIREVTSELTPEGYRLFRVNGRKILIRGAGWWSDMLLRLSPARQEAEIQYARDMHLNCLRLDGKFEDAHFLDLADRYGILLMPGWCCCDHWERWKTWKKDDYTISVESLRDRLRWFRNHPSILCWLNGDDNPPPEKVAQLYVNVLKEENWPNPYLASATGKPAAVTGATGLKMTGPYDWVPPAYWLADKHNGGAFGFITETSPGPAIPGVESLREFIPTDHLWPIDDYWNYHAGGGVFKDIKVYTHALNARYGEARNLDDFARKAQAQDYEGQRAMYEAYGRNKYSATGVLQEMMNSAWPSLIWVLYDYYLRPAGGYFGTKKALEPLHIQYSYDDRTVAVVNSLYRDFKDLKATARVYNFDLTQRFSKTSRLDVPEDGVVRAFEIPELPNLTRTYYVSLGLEDADGKLLSTNFYWLSTQPDVFDWKKTEWYFTPTKSLGDMTALETLPEVDLNVTASNEMQDRGMVTHVTVENPSSSLAFQVHLEVKSAEGAREIVPILWEDNYFSLLPGEKREVTAAYKAEEPAGVAPVVQVEGWNIKSKSIEILIPRGGTN